MNYSSYNLSMSKKSKYWEPAIVHIWFKEGTTYDTLYDDGIIRRYDILNLVNEYPVFNKLKDRKLFLKGKNEVYGISWSEEIDVSSWAAYDFGIDVTNEYKDYEIYLVGYKIKKARIRKNISQETLAELTGIDQATLSKIEKGYMNISIKTLSRISKALNAKMHIDIK